MVRHCGYVSCVLPQDLLPKRQDLLSLSGIPLVIEASLPRKEQERTLLPPDESGMGTIIFIYLEIFRIGEAAQSRTCAPTELGDSCFPRFKCEPFNTEEFSHLSFLERQQGFNGFGDGVNR